MFIIDVIRVAKGNEVSCKVYIDIISDVTQYLHMIGDLYRIP